MTRGVAVVLLLSGCGGVDWSAADWSRTYLQDRFQVGESVWAPWPDVTRIYLGTIDGPERGNAYRVVFPNGDRGQYHVEELRAVRLFRGELVLVWKGGDYEPGRLTRTGPGLEVELGSGARYEPELVALPRSRAGWPEPVP